MTKHPSSSSLKEAASPLVGQMPERQVSHLWMNFTGSAKPSVVIKRGDGAYVFDVAGKRFLDFLSGLYTVQIGYSFGSELGAAAAAQAAELGYASTWRSAHPRAMELAEHLSELSPMTETHCFFVSGGSEGIETAIKLAREYHLAGGEDGRSLVIGRDLAYHGTTLGALTVSGIDEIRAPFELGAFGRRVSCTSATRCTHCASRGGQCSLACADEIEQAILDEGPERVSMVLAEPLQNSGGMIIPPEGYHQRVTEICRRYGVIYCADEVITAFGRLGAWFGSSRYNYVPDIIVCAKGLTSGYQPLGAVLFSGEIAERLRERRRMFRHGLTFSGHPIATAVAIANLRIIEREQVIPNVLELETDLRKALVNLSAHDWVKEVRGDGFAWAMRIAPKHDNEFTSAGLRHAYKEWQKITTEAGIFVGIDMTGGELWIHLAPPLISQRQHIDEAATKLDLTLNALTDPPA